MDIKEMSRQVILDHYKNPYNKVETDVEGYIKRNALNPSCGDQVTVYLLIESDKIIDIKFNGNGCSICCASASVMTQELKGLDVKKALNKTDEFYNIVHNGDSDIIDQFEDAQVFATIKDFPARFKCAYLSWDTLKKIIEEQ